MALQNLITALVLDVYDHDTSTMGVKSISCDKGSRFVRAALTYRKVPYAVGTGATVTLTVVRSDQAAVSIPGRTVSEGRIEAELTDVATAVKGTLLGQFKIEDGTQVLRTEVFKINNGVALDIDADTWADEYQGYNLKDLADQIEAISSTIESIGLPEGGTRSQVLAKASGNNYDVEWVDQTVEHGSTITINDNKLMIYTTPFEPDEDDVGVSNIAGVAKVGLAVLNG